MIFVLAEQLLNDFTQVNYVKLLYVYIYTL